jgi:hypothetical protein
MDTQNFNFKIRGKLFDVSDAQNFNFKIGGKLFDVSDAQITAPDKKTKKGYNVIQHCRSCGHPMSNSFDKQSFCIKGKDVIQFMKDKKEKLCLYCRPGIGDVVVLEQTLFGTAEGEPKSVIYLGSLKLKIEDDSKFHLTNLIVLNIGRSNKYLINWSTSDDKLINVHDCRKTTWKPMKLIKKAYTLLYKSSDEDDTNLEDTDLYSMLNIINHLTW